MTNHTEKSLWTVFSKFIRLRDADWRGYVKCISCSTTRLWNDGIDAGHFYSVGSDLALKYNEINCNGQCRSCNSFKSGNLLEYRRGMIAKYGEKVLKDLEVSHYIKTTHKKLNQMEINALYNFYKKKIKNLEFNKEKLTPYNVK